MLVWDYNFWIRLSNACGTFSLDFINETDLGPVPITEDAALSLFVFHYRFE